MLQAGHVFVPDAESNPLGCRIAAFTTVSSDVGASIRFYRDLIGMAVAADETLPAMCSSAPGVGDGNRRHVLMTMADGPPQAAVRILEAPAGAAPNRPRPDSGPADPGLLAMEGRARDPAVSYRIMANANVPMISPPRYYFFRNSMRGRDIDVMSYALFGPGGEQLFLTARLRADRHDWPYAGQHSGFHNAAITSLDQRPVNAFYAQALGAGVSIEVWEVAARRGAVHSTSLDRTGLAMLTLAVDDLADARARCRAAGIDPVGEGALPLPGMGRPAGFTLRGAVGELIEIVQR